jgi:glycosyltransferase involved in cell wall biosynthesis
MRLRIAVVSGYFSEGMGYTENCLPKTLARMGHEVHVLTSTMNVYANSPDYERNYGAFLGPKDQGVRTFETDGYTVHRLPSRLVANYVNISGLRARLKSLRPDVVHVTEIASLPSYKLAFLRAFMGFKLFGETHQHMSIVKPYLRAPGGHHLQRSMYWLTRTMPTKIASLAFERCYAIAPDCVEVATRFYGVPPALTKLQSLGTDTLLFRPAEGPEEVAARTAKRASFGYGPDDIVCIYTGRFSKDKNPLVLARAVDQLVKAGHRQFHGLFVGEGEQKQAILECQHAQVRAFAQHLELSKLYQMADIAAWPRQESMSMLDAAASGLPLVVSADIGENERVAGNGRVYKENDVDDLARALLSLGDAQERASLAAHGRQKMARSFSWMSLAESVVADYRKALGRS